MEFINHSFATTEYYLRNKKVGRFFRIRVWGKADIHLVDQTEDAMSISTLRFALDILKDFPEEVQEDYHVISYEVKTTLTEIDIKELNNED